MTRAQALKKAKEVFGRFEHITGPAMVRQSKCYQMPVRNGGQGPTFCFQHGRSSGCPSGKPWFEIGTINPTLGCNVIQAGGNTWEEAFEKYEAILAAERARFAAAKAETKKRARR